MKKYIVRITNSRLNSIDIFDEMFNSIAEAQSAAKEFIENGWANDEYLYSVDILEIEPKVVGSSKAIPPTEFKIGWE